MVLMATSGKVSPKGSLKGWKINVWVSKNKDNLKLVAAAILGIIASTYSTSGYVQLLFGAGGAIGTKLILDTIDFFASSVQL